MSRLKTMAGVCVFCGFSIAAALNSYPTREDKERLAAYRAAEEAEFRRVAALLMPDQYVLSHDCSAGHQAQAHNVSDDDAADSSSYAHWSVRGAWEDDFFCVFPSGWLFPYGGGHWDHVWVDSRGALWLNTDDEQPVVGFDVPVSHVPGVSSFEHGLTPSNTYVFAWQGVAENRDGNQLTERRIELCRNGDAIVSTNGVSSTIPYEIPFAHDGYGQDEAWVRANFTRLQRVSPSLTNAEEIISIGYTNWVAQQVGVGQLNGLYKFTAEFTEDPPETTQFWIGDFSLAVTNAGKYVVVLKKGEEYEFGTWPFNDAVDYWAQDDMSADAPMLTSWLDGTTAPGEWTVDGGWSWLYSPYVYGGRYNLGRCAWWPTLQGSPDVVHLSESDFPIVFEALLSDYCGSAVPSFLWSSSDENIVFDTPKEQITTVNCSSLPSWATCSISVEVSLGENTLCSYLYPTYGTNPTPQVACSIKAPNAIFVNDDGDVVTVGKDYEVPGRHVGDDDIIPVTIEMHSDVETNGTIIVRALIRDGHLWKNENRDDEVFEERIEVSGATDFSKTYFLEAEYESYGYMSDEIQVFWHDGVSRQDLVTHNFTAINCIAEPITNERVNVNEKHYIVNPSCAIIGQVSHLRVKVSPTNLPDDKIVWRVCQGIASFPNGNTGRNVEIVAGGASGDTILLEVDIDGCSGRKPQFELLVAEQVEVLIYPYLIVGASGAELNDAELTERLDEVNEVYRQVGLHFSAAPIEIIDNYEWSYYGLAKKEIGRAICNYAHKTDGVEVYFIGDNQQVVDYDTKAIGRANRDGVVIRSKAPGRTLAHEIGHVCGLKDIYIDDNCIELYQPLSESRMPSDWNNGTGCRYYAPWKCSLDQIQVLLMYGVGSGYHVDIPLGPVYGLVKDRAAAGGRSLGNAAVGRSAMIVYPPHTR